MKIGMIMDIAGGTQAQYDMAMQTMRLAMGQAKENWPEGIISHVAGPIPTGWRVVDVWESKEHFQKFFTERLGAAMQAAGIPQSEPQFFDVYNVHTS